MCGILASFTPRRLSDEDVGNGSVQPFWGTAPDGHSPTDHASSRSSGSSRSELKDQLQAGIDAIRHRGPDGSGVWISHDASVGLAHCRLSIIDPSPSGAQPLHSPDGLVHAVVNGEIYDHDRLRNLCSIQHNYKFSGESDSELVIALYQIFGIPGFFEHLRGEFAFVLFDERNDNRRVIAARDRHGIKPLFWTTVSGNILFASEAKAFLSMGWEPEWDVEAIVKMGWLTEAGTVFKDVKKVLPGHWLEITDEAGPVVHQYWDAEYANKTTPDPRTIDQIVLGVRERLLEAVRLRLRADVPLGIYLSGGIDSSAIAGIVTDLVRKEGVRIGSGQNGSIMCFTIAFPHESAYDESSKKFRTIEDAGANRIEGIADRTAEWLNVPIVKLNIDENRLADDFADAIYHSEHHHFDLNAVAKYALSTVPGTMGVKTVLTGEGSDEHFGGYLYFLPEFLREGDMNMPHSLLAQNHNLRDALQAGAASEMSHVWRSAGLQEYKGIEGFEALRDLRGNTMPNTILTARPADALFSQTVRQKYLDGKDLRETFATSYPPTVREKMREDWHPSHTAMYIGNKSTFANVLLSCLGDRTEMAHSLEARTPFLDHQLTQYVNQLPPSLKLRYVPPSEHDVQSDNMWVHGRSVLRSFTDKWILREAVRPYITDELYNRKKFPFLAPARWPIGGPLHAMFKRLLTREAVEDLGFVDYARIEEALRDGFGSKADSGSFRTLCYTASWVVLSQRLGIKRARV